MAEVLICKHCVSGITWPSSDSAEKWWGAVCWERGAYPELQD